MCVCEHTRTHTYICKHIILQVNVRLKGAMEEQSLEIVRLRGLLGSMGVNASGDWSTPATDVSRRLHI
jgi:hypothetical protein